MYFTVLFQVSTGINVRTAYYFTIVLILHNPMNNFREYIFIFLLKEILTYLESYKNHPTPTFHLRLLVLTAIFDKDLLLSSQTKAPHTSSAQFRKLDHEHCV